MTCSEAESQMKDNHRNTIEATTTRFVTRIENKALQYALMVGRGDQKEGIKQQSEIWEKDL